MLRPRDSHSEADEDSSVVCDVALSTDKHTAVSERTISSASMQTGYILNSKTLVASHQRTRHQIPEDFYLRLAMNTFRAPMHEYLCCVLRIIRLVETGTYKDGIYRVIHKSLWDFRTRLSNNQDRHGRKEHINR